ncbi:MAG: DUF748 domain-containing protein [Prolixibacteraceae bacterium]|jgi:hypothetical protein|nr:DUF748 domain-containing protein [Prolixibacteraceae bacterium]
MSKNNILKISLGIVSLVFLILVLTKVVAEPWIRKKIEATLNEKYSKYQFGIGKVNILFLKSGMTIENLTINTRQEQNGIKDLTGEITSISLKGINLSKILFKKDIEISEVAIFNSCIRGKIPLDEKNSQPILSGLNIRIDHLFFNMIELSFGNKLSAKTYGIKNGLFNVYFLQVAKLDTISPSILNAFDFEADELLSVSSDSLYSFKVSRFKYSETTKTLTANSFSIHPNYNEYAFTLRSIYQTDRIEADFSKVIVQNISVSKFIKSGSLISSGIEIGKMDLNAFSDKRIQFKHVNKELIQNMIYNYPGSVNIDSISLLTGSVTYKEHAKEANSAGQINFTEVNAKIYNLSNDTVYKREKAYLKLNVNALLMGKGKLAIQLKGRLFDRQNTFSLIGSLSEMDAGELNPILEKNTFIRVTSGKIDAMKFSIIANNTKAKGEMTLLYHGLNVALINERTDDTTAAKERIGSLIANIKILNSNPLPGNKIRKGIILNERDPEKFLFNYCFKSILSGITSSLTVQKEK